MQGTNVSLTAADDLLLQSATNTSQSESSNKSSGGSIGLGLNLGSNGAGLTVDIAAQMARGGADGNSLTHTETVITAANQLTLNSGNDTTLHGSQARGEQVTAIVGGDLNLISQQDQENYESRNKSAGINLSIPIAGTGSISGNYAADKVDLAYQSVNEQTGLYAGQGGFDINVGGNTDLKGAVIASEASADQNRLTTNTLTYSDLQNRLDWEAEAQGFSLGLNTGPGLDPRGLMPGLPVDYDDSDHREGSTLSAIGAGTLTVRQDAESGANSTAGLSRDTATANAGSVANNFDQSAVQENIELSRAQAELASQLAPILYKEIGLHSAKAGWAEDAPERIALHALGSALLAALGGGDILAGMGVGAANKWMVGQLDAYFKANPELSKGEQQAISLAASALLGVALDGVQGAAIATNATQHNYLNSRDVAELNRRLLACRGEENCINNAREWMLARDSENSAAFAACTTEKCLLAHAAALQAGNYALLNSENAYLSLIGFSRIEALQAGDAIRIPEQLKGLATVVGYAQANCGGVWNDACHASWNDNQSRLDQNAKLLVAAIYAPAAVAGGTTTFTALRACLGNRLCMNELAIVGMETVAGDALGGATLATGGTAVAATGGRAVANALDGPAARLSDNAIREALVQAQKVNKVEDLFGQTFDVTHLSHTAGRQDGVLGEQLALQLLNEKTTLNFRPLQNASNHGCDGCAVAINGDTITVVVMDAKSSQNGVGSAASAQGDPVARLRGWLSNESIARSDPKLAATIRNALRNGAKIQGVTVKVGIPSPGTTGVAEFKVEPWPKK